MPGHGFWMTLGPLLTAIGTAAFTSSGVDCHSLCLIDCPPGQHYMDGNCLECPAGFYCLGGRRAPRPCPVGTFSWIPGLTDSKDCQRCPPGQEPNSQHTGCVFCPVGNFFTERGPGCQLCLTAQVEVNLPQEGKPMEPCSDAGHFCTDGAASVPCPAGSFEVKRESSQPSTNLSCLTGARHCFWCPAGYFCPSGTIHPIPCQPGTFGPLQGQDEATDCTPCPAGRACTQAGLSQPDAECTPGYVCPPGSSSPHAVAHACPPGTFSNRNNLFDLSQCETCPAGLACPGGTGGPDSPSNLCPAGHYCPPGTRYPTQFQCLPGTWSNQTGLASAEECMPCPRGWFCVSGAQEPSGMCQVGHYCPQGTKWATQFPCPAGTYSFQIANEQLESCLLCPPGAFCPSGAPKPVLCPRGTYLQGSGARLPVDCAPCPAGHHCPELGTTAPLPCGIGSFSGPGHLWCQECPGGKLCNQTKLAGPLACPPGNYCPTGGLLLLPCPPGTFRETPGAAREDDCQLCHPGTFCGRAGLAEPEGLCCAGHYCGPGSTTSSPEGLPFGDLCPPGHFCPAGTKDPKQRPCPAGTWNEKRGATDLSWCLPCPLGLFCAQAGQAAPSGPCMPGFYCTEGAQTPRPVTELWGGLCFDGYICSKGEQSNSSGAAVANPDRVISATKGGPCPPGYYCPVGTGVPFTCPVGTFSDRMFLSMASECLACPSGHFCGTSGLAAPSGPCSPGYFCLSGVSSPTPAGPSEQGGLCPPGHFCPRGTSLPQPCPAGYYNNLTGQAACFPCAAGYYCPENSTSYSGYPCSAGFYCPQGTKYATQFPCPRGYYNPDLLAQSLDSCLPCPPGHYCGQENLTQASGLCDPGWFCVSAAWTSRPFDLDNYTSTNCLCPATATGGKCLAGFYCPEGSSEPTLCPPGSFCAIPGLSAPSGPCQAGYFCTKGAMSPTPEDGGTGAPCPSGAFCPAGSRRPTLCPAGTFSSLLEQTSPSTCQACPSGFYCKQAGLQAPSGQCPAGYYCDSSEGPVQDFSLYPCPQGYYCPLGTTRATHYRCPMGTYGPQKGLASITECQLCPAGKFCALAGLTAPTGDCAAGHWCREGASTKDPVDGKQGLLCPAGHFCLKGTLIPVRCPPGTWSQEGSKTPEGCQPCSAGHICSEGHPPVLPASCHSGSSCNGGTAPAMPMEGLSGKSCLPGHFCPLGMTDFTSCPPGTYSSSTHTTECHICPRGHYCVPGQRPQLCPRGFYCLEGTGLEWQPCPPGTYSPVPGLSTLTGCLACAGGRFCPTANATETGGECWEGFFCSRGSTRPNPEPGTEEGAGPCPQGHYCPRGSAVPQPCPPGTFSSRIKLSSEAACSPCLPGHYCSSAGLSSPSGPCSEGFFCLGGTTVPSGSLGDETSGPCPAGYFCPPGTVTPRPCPAGTYNPLASQSHCGPCPQGFFCPANSSSVVGKECPAGHYCPAATRSASQFPCPRGTYRPEKGGIQLADCTPCEPGSYCLWPGLAAVSGPCSVRFYCAQGALVPTPTDGITGDLCPPGHFCPQGSPRPVPCPPGSFLPTPGATSVEDCQSCPAGWFCSQLGLSSPEAPCEGGWYCPKASVSGHSPGSLCPPGHSCPPGSLEPQLCPPGQYQDEAGQSLCKTCPSGKFCPFSAQGPGLAQPIWPVDCPAGYYCPLGTQTPTQYPCPSGTFRDMPGAHSAEDCTACPAGQFCSDSGKHHPDGPCSVGYYCPPGQTSATPSSFRCPCGFYCPEGSARPHACENGTFQPQEGSSSCEICPAGFYCDASSAGPAACGPSLCPQGHFCPPGTHSATARPCPRGMFGSRLGAAGELDCEPCPAGMFCLSEGLAQPSGLCQAAYYCTGGAASPTPIKHKVEASGLSGNDICPPGFFCPEGSGFPVPCPPGLYSSGPGLESVEQCQPCPPGQYCSQSVVSHTLQIRPCEAGFICLGGSAVPSPSDGIWGYRCPLGFRCPPGAHRELPCEPGTYGPLPGASTCLPCPGGTYCRQAATVEATTCPKGHYCPPGAASALPCPEGTLSPQEGAFSSEACQLCPSGRYCSGEGSWQPKGPCSAGYYCEAGATSPTPQGTSASYRNGPCPRGHYCPEGTLYPIPCPMGTLSNSTGGISKGSCVPCPAGSFCPSLGLSSPAGSCAAGFYCPSEPSASSPMVLLCPQGHFCQAGAAQPTLCHRGEYQPSLGSDTCLVCPPGFYCPHPGTRALRPCPAHAYCPAGTWSPPPCPLGTFTPRDASGLREEGDCSVCPPGHYCRGGQIWGKCPAGYFCPAGTSELMIPGPREPQTPCPRRQLCGQQCPPGFYCPEGSGQPSLCPPHTMRVAPGGKQREDCEPCPPGQWCKAGDPGTYLCPAGHYCPGGSRSSPGMPQACPMHTYLAATGSQSQAECLPCPAGYHCPFSGLASFEDRPCPPGHWCPGGQGAFLCPPGTFRTKPGASSWEECELCPSGYYCPDAKLTGHASVFAIPCGAGSECPAGAVAEVPCRAGSYCGPQTGVPPLCPRGYVCPGGSSTYTGPGQLCVFPYYCPLGSARPLACPGGSEALNVSELRVSEETCCRLCAAGTYRSGGVDSQPCQPCPPGFSCPQGTESYQSQPCPLGHYCPARTGSPRACPAGTFGNSSEAQAAGACLPCPEGTFSPLPGQMGCLSCGSSAFSPPGSSHCVCRGLNRVFQKSDGACICQAGHVFHNDRGLESDDSDSDEDCQPQIAERCSSGEVRLAATRKCVSPQRHDCSSFCHPVGGTLSTNLGICQCWEYVSAELFCDAQCLAKAPHLSLTWGTNRELILRVKDEAGNTTQRDMVSTLGSVQPLQRSTRTYLVQCGPYGTFGFIVSSVDVLDSFLLGLYETRPLFHQTVPSGPQQTIPQDTSRSPYIQNPIICLEEGDAILFRLHILPHNRSASHYPVYQKQHLFNSNPQWDFGDFRRLHHLVQETHLNFSRFAYQFQDAGTYVFRDNGLADSVILVLVKKGAPCDPGVSRVQPSSLYQLAKYGIRRHQPLNLAPDWAVITGVLLTVGLATTLLTSLGLILRPTLAWACPRKAWQPRWRNLGKPSTPADLLFYKGHCLQGYHQGDKSREQDITRGSGELLTVKTLEDFSIRTLYDKLEDQTLHVAAQLSKHRSDTLAFYTSLGHQIQGLQLLVPSVRCNLKNTSSFSSANGCTPRVSPQSTPLELNRAIAALENALSHSPWGTAEACKKAPSPAGALPPSACPLDPHVVNATLLEAQLLLSGGGPRRARSQEGQGPPWLFPSEAAGREAESPGPGAGTSMAGHWGLQRKIWQVEDTLDKLNEEFFQITAQALELQKKEKSDQLLPSESDMFMEDCVSAVEMGDLDGENLPAWAMKSDRALVLEVTRLHLACKIEDLEWELSLLLQVAGHSTRTDRSWPSQHISMDFISSFQA